MGSERHNSSLSFEHLQNSQRSILGELSTYRACNVDNIVFGGFIVLDYMQEYPLLPPLQKSIYHLPSLCA